MATERTFRALAILVGDSVDNLLVFVTEPLETARILQLELAEGRELETQRLCASARRIKRRWRRRSPIRSDSRRDGRSRVSE